MSDTHTILVVDDEQRMRELLRHALMREGYNLIFAATGKEALLAMGMRHPDLVLLDLAMPDLDGVGLLEIIRTTPEWATLPVIVITAFSTSDRKTTALKLGAAQCLTKAEFSIRELREQISHLLQSPPQKIPA